MNLVIHSVGGELRLEISHSMIHLFSKDDGPGIENIELAMKEDFSTASGIWCRDGTLVYMTYLIELGAHRMKGYNHHLSLNIDDCISCTRCMRVCSTEAI